MKGRYTMKMELGKLVFSPKNEVMNILDNIRHLGAIVRNAGVTETHLLIHVELVNPRTKIEAKRRRLESCGIELLDEFQVG